MNPDAAFLKYRSCATKQVFATQMAAQNAVNTMRYAKKIAGRASAYKCQFCGKWHWGHKRKFEGMDNR